MNKCRIMKIKCNIHVAEVLQLLFEQTSAIALCSIKFFLTLLCTYFLHLYKKTIKYFGVVYLPASRLFTTAEVCLTNGNALFGIYSLLF